MAELLVKDDQLILHLSDIEKAEALHGDLHAPISAVRDTEVIDNAKDMTRIKTGFKVGMRIPGSASVAVVRRPGHKIFVAIHHDTPQALRIAFEGDSYNEWYVGLADPRAVLASLKLKN